MENFFKAIKSPLIAILQKEITKIAIANFIKSSFMLDFRMWFIKFSVDYLTDHLIKPSINYFFQKAGYLYEVIDGEHILKKVQNASNSGEWSSSVDRV